jgi:nicotinate dehydrogenase subunit B
MNITLTVNGEPQQVQTEPDRPLLEVLRDELGLTGPKYGCGEGACGACTVLAGQRAIASCVTPAADAAGARITTVEGLAEDGTAHPVQQAWLETGAFQCGYCTPGWLCGTAALLARVAHPSDERIAAELAGHLCRCCSYPRILRAVRRAAELMEQPEELMPVPDSPATPASLAAPAPGLAGEVPLDLSGGNEGTFFEVLPDGLVTVADGEDTAWVHVGADGSVTAFTGKVEAGQGTRTALALLVAEELAVSPDAVRVVMGNTDVSPFDWGTFGSGSMPYAAPPLRAAAATAREVIRELAAERFGMPAAGLTVAGGMVAGPDGAPAARLSELLTGIRRVQRAASDAPVTPPGSWRTAGRGARAAGGAEVVTGAKRFPADLRLDGMLHGCVLRPPAVRARLRGAGTAVAAAVPGARIVRDGDFIGAVAASPARARRAVEAIEASWEVPPQPARDELEGYLRAHLTGGRGRDVPFRHVAGDVRTALAAGPVRLEATYTTAYIAHVPLEPRSAIACWRDGRLTVWTGTSTPFRARAELAEAFGIPEHRVSVVVADYGGGFGGKHGGAVAIEAARLAKLSGQPVKVQWSRREEFCCGYLRPAAIIDIASSAAASGELTGWSHRNINSGSFGILTPYRVPHQLIEYLPADSPLPKGSYRALAATANHFARESHMDELAVAVGVDPLEFRLRHLDDARLAAVFRAAAGRLGWQPGARPAPGDGGSGRTGAGPSGRTGTGIAGGIEKGGRVATAAEVLVDAGGRLRVLRLVTGFDCGAIVNPDNLANQIEGAVMMGLGGALFEAIDFAGGQIRNASLSGYRVPRLPDLPSVEVVLLDQPGEPPAGGGETPIVAVAPAIGNAIAHATGVRLRSMPLAPDGAISAR